MVTGPGPQSKVMMPPWATAATTAAEVQLAGVPVPIDAGRVRGVDGRGLGRDGGVPSGLVPGAEAPRVATARAIIGSRARRSMGWLSASEVGAELRAALGQTSSMADEQTTRQPGDPIPLHELLELEFLDSEPGSASPR